MKLLAKFNLILGLVLGAGLTIAALMSRQVLESGAREDVLRQARLMMASMSSARACAFNQVTPLLVTLPAAHGRLELPPES